MTDERDRNWIRRTFDRVQPVVPAPAAPASHTSVGDARAAVSEHCAHIDVAYSAGGDHLLLIGWAENAEVAQLTLESASGVTPLETVIVARPDVAQHLGALGREIRTNRHGFLATVPRSIGRRAGLRVSTGGRTMVSPQFPVDPEEVPLRRVLAMALQAAEESGSGVARNLERLGRPFLTEAIPEPGVARVQRFGPAVSPNPLRVSIIIPFYGDGSYLLDHLIAQGRAPSDIEWILVCDDPSLSPELASAIRRRQSSIRQPTSLIHLQANGGFGHANNVGAAHAHGEHLLLMNSDIYCRNFDFLDDAVSRMRADRRIGCVGFSLLFEDGTVQHDGMVFNKAPLYDGLWLSDHPGKGLPADWSRTSPADAQAVTAALMLIDRECLTNGRIFDPGYVFGDFEDGDFCMRLRQTGRSIKLVRTPGLYHLERQSVRRLADGDGRRAITMLNCLRFNARWAGVLDGSTTAAEVAS